MDMHAENCWPSGRRPSRGLYPWIKSFIEFEMEPDGGLKGWFDFNAPKAREMEAAEQAKGTGPSVLKPVPQKWRGAGVEIIIEH